MPDGEMYAFISYSRSNKDFVERLTADLRAHGVNVWIDQQNLKPGTPNWDQALRDAIQGSQAVLLIATLESRQSPYVSDELSIAAMYHKPVYPVWAAGEEWIENIRVGLGLTQFIDARQSRYATALDEIVTALGSSQAAQTASSTSEPPPDFAPRNPYKGLNAFSQQDRSDFFGRDTLVDGLVTAVQQADQERLLAVVGPSGSGKSSLVMAGLLPRLTDLHQALLPVTQQRDHIGVQTPVFRFATFVARYGLRSAQPVSARSRFEGAQFAFCPRP